MGNKQIAALILELKGLKAEMEELQAAASAIEDALKAEMAAQGVEELRTDLFTVRWTRYTSTRLDSKALKAELPEVWTRYSVSSEARRFTVA